MTLFRSQVSLQVGQFLMLFRQKPGLLVVIGSQHSTLLLIKRVTTVW